MVMMFVFVVVSAGLAPYNLIRRRTEPIATIIVESDISTALMLERTKPNAEVTPAVMESRGHCNQLPRQVLQHLTVGCFESVTIFATPRGSLLASTIPADSIATSVPAPIAMPIFACVSYRAHRSRRRQPWQLDCHQPVAS